jgi:NifB/MoaA-like Fe-S oxidoreductase
LLDEWEGIRAKGRRGNGGRGVVVCGVLIAPLLGRIIEEVNDAFELDITTIPIENSLFGGAVTVSGLLTAGDVMRGLRKRDLGDVVFVPRTMFDAMGKVTLDDLTLTDIEARLGVPVTMAGAVGEVVGYFGIGQSSC